jgi:hypothetical protein
MTEPTLCFCEVCFKSRGEKDLIRQQGDPPMEYTVPVGWVRIPINIIFDNLSNSNQSASGGGMTTSTSSLSNVLTTWHVAYHGLEIQFVRDVMGINNFQIWHLVNIQVLQFLYVYRLWTTYCG